MFPKEQKSVIVSTTCLSQKVARNIWWFKPYHKFIFKNVFLKNLYIYIYFSFNAYSYIFLF